MRTEVRALRKKFRRETNAAHREELRNCYLKKFNDYKTQINKSRTRAWREFCFSTCGKNPRTKAYYIARNEVKTITLQISVVQQDSSFTTTVEDTCKKILEDLFPPDDTDLDSPQQNSLRRDSLFPPASQDDSFFSPIEILEAFKSVKVRKAHGPDKISDLMVVNAFKAISTTFVLLFNSCLKMGYFPQQCLFTASVRLLSSLS